MAVARRGLGDAATRVLFDADPRAARRIFKKVVVGCLDSARVGVE